MDHVAIDLGGSQSQICRRDERGQVLEERRWRTAELSEYLAKRAPSRVIVETCTEAFRVADAALELGHQVRVVPSTLVKSLGVGAGRRKSDKRDAQVLSEVSTRIDLPSVHIPSQRARQWKSLCGMRDGLVEGRTKLINTVRGWLRGQGRRLGRGTTQTFATRVRALAGLMRPSYVERQLEVITVLNEQIRCADRDVRQALREEPAAKRLMTVPGVGEITAMRFLATLDDVKRFTNGHQVAAYVGLAPGEWSSSERERRTGITKAGSRMLRAAMIQAAWSARRARRPDAALKGWAAQVEQRRGKYIAVVALARKLVGILYALWRNGSTYDPQHARAEVTATGD